MAVLHQATITPTKDQLVGPWLEARPWWDGVAEAHLLGTMDHSVLGSRWVYDGCGDPVFVTMLVEVVRSAGTNAELEVQMSDGSAPYCPKAPR